MRECDCEYFPRSIRLSYLTTRCGRIGIILDCERANMLYNRCMQTDARVVSLLAWRYPSSSPPLGKVRKEYIRHCWKPCARSRLSHLPLALRARAGRRRDRAWPVLLFIIARLGKLTFPARSPRNGKRWSTTLHSGASSAFGSQQLTQRQCGHPRRLKAGKLRSPSAR